MEQRNLEIYTFSLYDKNDLEQKIDYSNVYGKDLFEVLKKETIQYFENLGPEKIFKKTIKIDSDDSGPLFKKNNSLRILSGKVKIGDDDGKVQDFTKGKRKTVVYTKQKGVYAERPFFFLLVFPKNKKYGFMVLEKEGVYSCKKVFVKAMQILVKEKMGGLLFREEKFIEKDLIRQFIVEGEYKTISLSRKNLSKSLQQKYLGDYEDGGEYEIEILIKTKNGTDFKQETKNKVLKNLENYDGFFNTKEFENIGFDDKTHLKINSVYDGTRKTIDLSDTMKVRPYYTVDVVLDDKGFAEYTHINKEAVKILESFDLDII